MPMKQTLIFVALIALLSWPVLADDPAAVALEKEARQIDNLLIAPCCWRQPVSDHFSPAADEIRAEVRQMLSLGMTREQILNKYIDEYGERILSKPPAQGFGTLAYFLPFLFLAAGAAVALVVIRSLRPRTAPSIPEVSTPKAESKYSSRLERELWG